MRRKLQAISLIELLAALVLLSVIVLAVSNFEIFGRFHTESANRRVKIQNEATLVLEQMSKDISRAIGNRDNPPFENTDNQGLRIRIDSNSNGRLDTGVDTWVGYRRIGSQILFCSNNANQNGSCPGATEVVANNIVPDAAGFSVTIPEINQVEINVSTRWLPAQLGSVDNPEVNLRTTVIAHSVSTH